MEMEAFGRPVDDDLSGHAARRRPAAPGGARHDKTDYNIITHCSHPKLDLTLNLSRLGCGSQAGDAALRALGKHGAGSGN
jgi:hypothetical protein